MDNAIIGIDLGTTNTVVCYMKGSKPTFLRFPPKGKMLPSVIYVEDDGSVIVGKEAQNARILDPDNGVSSAKTYMGKEDVSWTCRGRKFTPTDVATEILKCVREKVIEKLNLEPDTTIQAVITVPAEFSSNQIDETKQAGERAGLKVIRIITEPMAAAVAAGNQNDLKDKILVVDFGGGTFDLVLLKIGKNEEGKESYKAEVVGGDRTLGGDRFDEAVYNYFLFRIKDDIGVDMASPATSGLEYNAYTAMMGQLKDAAVRAKEALSNDVSNTTKLINLFPYKNGMYSFNVTLTREKFDELSSNVYAHVDECIQKFIAKGNIQPHELTEVILAGGSCYIPYIRQEVERIFNRPANAELDLDTIVAHGACIIAEYETSGSEKDEPDITEIISHSLGVEAQDPDNKAKSILSKILRESEPYPCANTRLYTTSTDNQDKISVNIYEAGSGHEDSPEIDDRNYHELYAGMELSIKPAPAGTPRVAVTFSYDKSRALTVTAVDLSGTPLADVDEEHIHTKMTALTEVEKKQYTSKSLRISMKRRQKVNMTPRQKPLDIVLLLDSSDSMSSYNAIAQAKRASKDLVDKIDFSIHRLGIVNFDDSAHKQLDLSQDKERMKAAIDNIRPNGLTDMIGAFEMASGMLRDDSREKMVIMVTDGFPCYRHLDDNQAVSRTIECVQNIREKNRVKFATIGAGDGVDEVFLHKIADNKCAKKIDNFGDLLKAFKEVLSGIMEIK